MRAIDNITGQVFTRLLALRPFEKRGARRYWLCRCECGKETIVNIACLRNGDVRSCGCLSRERSTTHGMSGTKELEMFKNAMARSRRQKIPFTISLPEIVIPKVCPLLNIPLFSKKGSPGDNSPSLDRKIPTLGYVPGNVWVISHKANTMKSSATIEELELMARNWRASI